MTPHFRFSYERDWRHSPLAFWVHIPLGRNTPNFEPPAPHPVPHKGYVVLHVEFDGVDLQFSSPAQVDHFIEVLSLKPMPTSRQLAARRGENFGPNGHWLSRLPAAK